MESTSKMSKKPLWTLLPFFFLCFAAASSFTYEDLKLIPSSCFKHGTCNLQPRNRLDLSLDWKDESCFCDDECIKYGDCCLDANAYDAPLMRMNHSYECVEIPLADSYYMKGSCPQEWQDSFTRDLCYGADPGSGSFHQDPFLDTPTTSLSSSITYKNYYCAICNGELPTTLEIWNARFSCATPLPYSDTYTRQNIEFINGKWGIHVTERGETVFMPCSVFPAVPETVQHKVRKCIGHIPTCDPTWTNKTVEDLCHSYTTLVYGPLKDGTLSISTLDDDFIDFKPSFSVYKNYHCAKCNYANDSDLNCYIRDYKLFRNYIPVSFSVLFDFGVRKSQCKAGEIWDAFSKACREVVCLHDNYEFRNGRCEKMFDRVIELVSDNTTLSNETLSNMSAHFISCDKMFFGHSEITEGANGSIIINSYRTSYAEGEYSRLDDGILVCIPQSFSKLMGWLTSAGLSLSCICLLIHLLVFLVVPDLQNISGKNLASMCTALLVAYLCFLVTASFDDNSSGDCRVLASVMYYFFLASFAWVNVMAFDVWRTLKLATSELRLSSGKQWKKFFIYSLYAWLIPALALSAVLIIDYLQPELIDPSYLPELGSRFCWFGQKKAILLYFAAPLACIMILNMVFFILAVKMVAMTTRTTTQISSSQPHQVNLKLYLRLAVLMGLSWIFGIVGGYLQNEYLWYIFILLNTMQGVFVLIAFTCTKKVYRALGLTVWRGRGPINNARACVDKTDSGNSRHTLQSKDSNTSATYTTHISGSSFK